MVHCYLSSVFVGGCATGLFITDTASAPVRATRDVDVIAELASYGQYAGLGERLRKQGFSEDTSEGAPVCRWTIGDMLLDVMPASGKVLGFTNQWYAEAVQESQEFKLTSKLIIRLIGPSYFLATKFVAFHSRGRRDFYTSHDLEDIITVVDGREELFLEIERSRRLPRSGNRLDCLSRMGRDLKLPYRQPVFKGKRPCSYSVVRNNNFGADPRGIKRGICP